MDREKIVDYLKTQIDKHIEFDSVPENDDGWYEVKRKNIYKIVDGLIPLIKEEIKKSRAASPILNEGNGKTNE